MPRYLKIGIGLIAGLIILMIILRIMGVRCVLCNIFKGNDSEPEPPSGPQFGSFYSVTSNTVAFDDATERFNYFRRFIPQKHENALRYTLGMLAPPRNAAQRAGRCLSLYAFIHGFLRAPSGTLVTPADVRSYLLQSAEPLYFNECASVYSA
jgi:hypothetical protein